MENVKLTYFNDNGRVGLIRAMLSFKKIPFENIMLTLEEWPSKKDNYEFKQLPQLEVNGKKLTQTIAICLYLARQLNLYPKDIYLQYHVDSLLACRDDISLSRASARPASCICRGRGLSPRRPPLARRRRTRRDPAPCASARRARALRRT